MTPSSISFSAAALGGALLAMLWLAVPLVPVRADSAARALPPPALDIPPNGAVSQTAVLAGGCFWGVQGVFDHVKGVTQTVTGYMGGHVANPEYEQVSAGTTGHAEAVSVTFDPAVVSYGTLLQIFFSVALDPTQKDRQGPDWGTQYRSEVFVNGPEQEQVAKAYIAQLEATHAFSNPIATRIDPAGPFYPAEAYHQHYLHSHPNALYIVRNDLPKVKALQTLFPESWRPIPVKAGKLASGD
jgi:peptide-methionine (S)-S-oxide reductase